MQYFASKYIYQVIMPAVYIKSYCFTVFCLGSSDLMFSPLIPGEVNWAKGKVSGAVYWGDEKLTDLLVKVYLILLLH